MPFTSISLRPNENSDLEEAEFEIVFDQDTSIWERRGMCVHWTHEDHNLLTKGQLKVFAMLLANQYHQPYQVARILLVPTKIAAYTEFWQLRMFEFDIQYTYRDDNPNGPRDLSCFKDAKIHTINIV